MGEEQENSQPEPCHMCKEKTLVLSQRAMDIPFFGKVFMFSMTCTNCKYHMSDVETSEKNEPAKYTFEITNEEDMKVRVVKSSEATLKLPFLSTIEPGPASKGYVTNIEGVLNRIKYQVEAVKETSDDDSERKKAKNILKKIFKIKTGQEKQKVILEDPSGNSAIVSEKAKKEKLKVKKS